jgi:hypothetical protein
MHEFERCCGSYPVLHICSAWGCDPSKELPYRLLETITAHKS